MSDACFHNFDLNRMIYKAISTNDLPSAPANLVVKTPFPVFFASLFKSPFTPSKDSAILCELFGHSFANRFLQNRDFFSTHRNSIPYTRGVLMCLLTFWPFPAFFACLFKSSFTPSEDSSILCELFGQSFANRFLQNQDFFSTHQNSIPYTRGVLMCLLGFWPSGPKPCGGNKLKKFIMVLFIWIPPLFTQSKFCTKANLFRYS